MSIDNPETWLFDLGNSRTKVARLAAGRPVETVALDWARPDFAQALHAHLARWPQPARVWVASVAADAHRLQVQAVLTEMHPARVEWLRTPRRAGGIRNSYARPERLGIDRFLAMLAGYARSGGACVVVGCGTALTLDAIASDGQHAEGQIALSPHGMLQALHGATAIADRNPDAFVADAADDTARALKSGCWAAAGALVEWFVARSRARGPVSHVWLHGGWAAELAAWLAADGVVVETLDDAVLCGLAAWAVADNVESPAGNP